MHALTRSPAAVCAALLASAALFACGETTGSTNKGLTSDTPDAGGYRPDAAPQADAAPTAAPQPDVGPTPGTLPPEPDAGLVPKPDGAAPPPPDAAVGPESDAEAPTPDAAPPEPDAFVPPVPDCPEPALGDAEDWRHNIASPLVTLLGHPQHSSVEPIVNVGSAISVAGRFEYGAISKDLEDEDVGLYIRFDPCGEFTYISRLATNSDGSVAFDVDPGLFPGTGNYEFRLVVMGDQTQARGSIWIVDPGTAFVLFDVDGTLTIGDQEIFQQVLLGQDPEMYDSADQVAWAYSNAGYQPIYVTGRPYFLNLSTRNWLDEKGFPEGPVRTTDTVAQAMPTAGGVQTYKRDYLDLIQSEAGVVIPYGYGNATTDICAYAQTGISPAQTYIIGPNGGGACDGYAPSQVVADYPSHLPTLQNLPPAP